MSFINTGKSQFLVQKNTRLKGSKIEHYQIERVIGQGAYAEVKEAYCNIVSEKVALKMYEKYKLIDPQKKRNVIREIRVLERINHPNIVKLYDSIDTPRQVVLVLELIKGKSLRNYIKEKHQKILTEKEASSLIGQISSALAYCHNKSVTHRDIKMDNILIEDNGTTKLIDFGFSILSKKDVRLNMFCGTPSYMSPEIINKKDYFGPPSDMWAVGVILYAMLTGTFPFKSSMNRELYRKISKGSYLLNETLSKSAKSLITHLLQVDPNKRLTAQEVLNHEFVTMGRFSLTREPSISPNNSSYTEETFDQQVLEYIVKMFFSLFQIKLGYRIDEVISQLKYKGSHISILYQRLLAAKNSNLLRKYF